MMRKLRYTLSLSGNDQRLLFQAWLLLLVVDLGLRIAPFRFIQKLLTVTSKSTSLENISEEDTFQNVERIVDVAGNNHLYPMTCLRRALVLQRLLALRGIETELRFGVHKGGNKLSAHAWLEYQGQSVSERRESYQEFIPISTQEVHQRVNH